MTIGPAFNKVEAATASIVEGRKTITGNNALPHRTLGTGKAAFEVSALGFGVMGMTYNRSQHPDKKQCIRLLHEAVERGVTLFDTAIIYGPLTNENLAGEALSEFKGRINVTTKFGHEVIAGKATGRQDSSRKTIRQYCEDSLRRLKLETLPMFYQHRADPNTPAEEVAQTISELMKEGKVQHWGMCEVSADTIRKAHAVCPLTAIQSEYHLMHRLVEENGVLDVCRELGIGFVPYSPINRGFLWWNTQRIYRFRCEQRQPPYPALFPARYDACQYQNRQCLARFRPSARNDIGASGTRLAATESSVDCSHSRNDQIVAS